MAVTNNEFGERLGLHFTMASKYRNGQRMPSSEVLAEIWHEFELPADELLESVRCGREAFGAYIRESVFAEE